MFPSHSPQQAVIASQLVSDLDRYARDLDCLLEERWDPGLYREVSDQFDRIQMAAQAFPRLSSAFTEVLISRAELVHALYTVRVPGRITGKVVACRAQHQQLLWELRRASAAYAPPTALAGRG